MNREIKFRAWNKERNIMCYDAEDNSEYYFDGIYSSDLGFINYRLNNSDKYLYQQYTGLKDENGVEIYEGDIVRVDYDGEGQYACSLTGKIVYLQKDAMFAIVDKDEVFIDTLESEVGKLLISLGNIHQNPELLNS